MDYWNNKEERKNEAIRHTVLMGDKYEKEIEESFVNSMIYGPENVVMRKATESPLIEVKQTDSVSAIFEEPIDSRVAVLNFASYKYPGGMFLNGSSAQEESLCHNSFLYNVLVRFKNTYYAWNNEHKNKALYLNRAIYSPSVVFEKYMMPTMDIIQIADVITCAAPNYGAARRWMQVSVEENTQALTDRIAFVKAIAEEQGVETLILGAWGCGVFKQDAKTVASLFKEIFTTTTIKKLVFPIPNDATYQIFSQVFTE